jgi:hypothetical protein
MMERANTISRMVARSDLTPMDVLHENMIWYHAEAHRLLSQIDIESPDSELLKAHAEMRDKAGLAAQALARYVHRPMAASRAEEPKTLEISQKSAPVIELIPVHPAADAAFRRAAAGLPPAKRDKL